MYILIIAMWAGALAKGDSVAITSTAPAFITEQACVTAGKQAIKEFETVFKAVKFVCVKRD